MKKYLLILFVFSFVFGHSQQKRFEIKWNGTRILETENSKIEVPSFQKENFSYSYSSGLTFFAQWNNNTFINEASVVVSAINYSPISRGELKDLQTKFIPSAPLVVLKNTTARDKQFASLTISPIIKENGVYKKITAFTINYSSIANRSAQDAQAVTNSVLSTGSWHRFYVDKTGVFRLSKSFLNQIGVNTNVDPRTIKIYGNGGAMLPLENDANYPIDLTENAVKFIGEEDGVFNDNDYILFYAEGPTGFSEENNTNINVYTNKSYYFVNTGGGNGFGKRIQNMIQPQGNADIVINTFQDYQFHELDEFNIGKLGRQWFGERFDVENEKEFTFNFPNLITTEPTKVIVKAAGVHEGSGSTTMQVKVNGNLENTLSFLPIDDPTLASVDSFNGNVMVSSPEITINLNYNNNGSPVSYAYLNYISIEATRDLAYQGEQLIFKNYSVETVPGIAEYSISNATSIVEIWDITDKYNVTSVANSNNEANFSFKTSSGELRNYVTVNSQGYFEPLRDNNTSVSNQNIKGTIFQNAQGEFQDVDYIIVSHNNLVSQAERLADINRNRYGLNVKVLTLNEIYTEFSSGNQDVSAIRNMIRYVYNNASTPENRVKYVCLFGDASYDYKNRITNNTNIVPSWQSLDSFSLTSSFVSDDFYGMMNENEGNMDGNFNAFNKLDIAVGRILAESPQRAKEMVDKVETYYQSGSYGSWRNNFIAIADDVDKSWEGILQETTNDIANTVTENKPFINAIKIIGDSYLQESTASGERYPRVNQVIRDGIEVGALVVNYFGHGGEDGLAAERVFTKVDAQDVKNICKFNLFVTVTCEFTKFDNPQRPTAGEYTYWNKEGGAIGLITTTRQIFVTVGVSFNTILEEYLFAFNSNEYPSMAEALRLTKINPNFGGITQRRLVFFIGDPAMKLAFPKPNIRLTKINDVTIDQETDVLKALSRAKLSGEVVDESGNVLSNYNGTLTATVFDKEIDRQTLANDGTNLNSNLILLDFKTLGEIIFKGQATITNGLFDFEFIVPRDIGIPIGNGKVSFYAKTEVPLQDQAGANFDIQIGGINENAEEDNIGPVINLFMNDENFVSGGITNEEPTLLAKLQDDNGINTASGVGHDIVAIIDGDETNPYVLNDYYQANVDDFQNGELSYPLRDLEPGLHTLSLKAWDVYNNSSIAEIEFIVHDKDEELVITNVLNYPNPFIDYTEFWFNHNSSDVLDVSVQIFTVSGKLVRTINGQTTGGSKVTSSLSKDIVWDGRDDFGEKIGKGVYIYKLKVKSNQLNKQVEKIQKLVIL
ncbi:type IX secretion system sortase PorU [Ichthyenterobacterium magnum]|nr:type IX secretion system sortase PorU [Ichthyenterobacterium magnum]